MTGSAITQVDWQTKKVQDNVLVQLHSTLLELFQAEEGVEAYLDAVKAVGDRLPKEEIVRVVWSVMMQTLNLIGKNQVQVLQIIVRQIKAHLPLLKLHTTSAKLELQLLNCVQISCYEDNKLLKVCASASLICLRYSVGCNDIHFW